MSDELPHNQPPSGDAFFGNPEFGAPELGDRPFSDSTVSGHSFDGQGIDADQSFDDPGFLPPTLDAMPTALTGWSTPALAVGAAVVAIAISGMLDDSGLAEHPYWVVPAIGLFAACAAVASQTVRRLVSAEG